VSHRDVLRLLFPVEMGGDFEKDLELEGKLLDEAQARAEELLREIFPDTANELLSEWERVCGLTPGASDPLALRRERVIQKLRELGRLDRAYYVALAATMGFAISIEELPPNVEGHGEESIFIWRIHVAGTPVYYFRAGESRAGERLCWWPAATALEGLFQDIKPAHTQLIFAYA